MLEPESSDGAVSEWMQRERVLWPWIARFYWSPAQDLHPSRRAVLAPGVTDEMWGNATALAHVSRHLLAARGAVEFTPPARDAAEYLIALMPQHSLARLARRVGLVLHRIEVSAADVTLDDDERVLLTQRMPLYWHTPAVHGREPEATGWYVLNTMVSDAPKDVRQRFEWKTPLDPGRPAASLPDKALLAGLIQKLLREFDSPWASSFATLRRPERQIRLRA